MRTGGTRILRVLAACAIVAAEVHAQSAEPAWRARGSLQADAFAAQTDTRARARLAGEVEGTEVSFDSTLGLSTSRVTAHLAAHWRPGPRHVLGLWHFRFERSGAADLAGEVRYAGETFAAGTRLNSRYRTEVLGAEYAFAALQGSRGELTLGLGAHRIQLRAALASDVPPASAAESAELLVPTLRLGATVALGGRAWAQAGWHEVHARRDEYRGRLRSVAATLHYRMAPSVAAVLGYRYFDLRLDVDRPDWIGAARSTFRGPAIGLAAVF